MTYYYIKSKRFADEIWAVKSYAARDLRLMCSSGFEAIVKVEGIIECYNALISPAGRVPCCWYHLTVEWEETLEEKQSPRILVFEDTKSTIFKVCDKTGFTLVDATGASVDAVEDFFDTVDKSRALEISGGIRTSDDGRYRITEEILHAGGYLYVLGLAKCTQKGTSSDAVICKPNHGYVDSKGHFIISRKPDKELTKQSGISVSVCYYMAAISFAVTLFSILCLTGVIKIA
jgi:hypothetical protein